MLCETPRHKAKANIPFTLIFDKADFEASNGDVFTYYNDIQINRLSPSSVSLYAGTNNIMVGIHGNGFINSPDLRVRVNE